MKKKIYLIACNTCGSYEWTRYPPRQFTFMRCRGCGKQLGDFEVNEKETLLRYVEKIKKKLDARLKKNL